MSEPCLRSSCRHQYTPLLRSTHTHYHDSTHTGQRWWPQASQPSRASNSSPIATRRGDSGALPPFQPSPKCDQAEFALLSRALILHQMFALSSDSRAQQESGVGSCSGLSRTPSFTQQTVPDGHVTSRVAPRSERRTRQGTGRALENISNQLLAALGVSTNLIRQRETHRPQRWPTLLTIADIFMSKKNKPGLSAMVFYLL